MLRAVLVTLGLIAAGATALLTTSAAPDDPAAAAPQSSLVYTEIHFDHALLPGSTGWFAVPIGVDRPAYVRIDMDTMQFSSNDLSAAMGIVAVENGEARPVFGWWSDPKTPILSATHDGDRHMCCLDIPTGWSTGTGNGAAPILLQPGQTLWVGLAAYQWDQTSFAHFTVSAQAILSRGAERFGDGVGAIDLYAEATRAGTSATALGRHVVARAPDLTLSFHAERHGLFMLEAWPGEGEATVDLTVPGHEPMTRRITHDEGMQVMTYRSGDYRVSLTDLEGPLAGDWPWVYARVFFAEIDVPADAAFIYP